LGGKEAIGRASGQEIWVSGAGCCEVERVFLIFIIIIGVICLYREDVGYG
jgi:hypothetical protein